MKKISKTKTGTTSTLDFYDQLTKNKEKSLTAREIVSQ